MSIMRFVENKAVDPPISERPSEGQVQMLFNRSGGCLMCGHTPGSDKDCCPCYRCVCCTKKE